jgi:ethanolamine utilization protein EutP
MTVEKPMKQARYMVWGSVGAGKTTLVNALNNNATATARKTQAIDFRGQAIDTPGEYADLGHLRRNLQATASDVQLLLVVVDATRPDTRFPPNYFVMFSQPVIGIVNKTDIATDAEVAQATRLLREIGVQGEIFFVSAINGSSLEKLRQYLLKHLQ